MRANIALWATPALMCGVLGFTGLGLTSARADVAACKSLANAMRTNARTPYHSVGTISFDPKDPPIPGHETDRKTVPTEMIFTGKRVFVKLPNGAWKDIHANIADLQSRVEQSAASFSDCTHLPDDKTADKGLSIYTGTDKNDTIQIETKVWVAKNGALMRTETEVSGPTAPDGKIRHQHLSLRYDYNNIKAPTVSN